MKPSLVDNGAVLAAGAAAVLVLCLASATGGHGGLVVEPMPGVFAALRKAGLIVLPDNGSIELTDAGAAAAKLIVTTITDPLAKAHGIDPANVEVPMPAPMGRA